jgi:protein-L-isoaspartate(D-aspartate) O-methyltransferase
MIGSMADSGLRRRALVDKLLADGQIRSPRVAAAFAAVPRELFVPGVPLEEVYRSNEAILTKRIDGVGVSSASAPDVMAAMLEQLDVQPGMRVLEIGAGTGYNAALLACLVGERGTVTTLDIDTDIVEGARAHLATAGFPQGQVTVVEGDGALGYARAAPYDRIMLTVASRDLAPAWTDQLAPHGRLLLPLSIRGVQRCVAFEPHGDHLQSIAVGNCNFIPLRGVLAMESVRFPLDANGAVSIGLPDEVTPIAPEIVLALLLAATERQPTGLRASGDDIRHGLQLWLAGRDASVCSLWAEANARVLPDVFGQQDRFRATLGLLDRDGLALLAVDDTRELCVCAAPSSVRIAERLVEHVRAWQQAGRPMDADVSVSAYPRGHRAALGGVMLEQRWTRFQLTWGQDSQPPASLTV